MATTFDTYAYSKIKKLQMAFISVYNISFGKQRDDMEAIVLQ